MKKRLLTIITCIALLILGSSFSVFASSDSPILSVGQVSAEGGASVEVPISISGNPGVCGATIMVTYDDRLNLTAVSAGDAFSSLTMTKPGDMSVNPVNILWDGTDADKSNGVIAKLSFTVPKSAGTYPVSVTYAPGDIVDGDLNPVTLSIENGSITVQSQEMKDQEAAAAVEEVINSMDPTDKASVAEARAAYDALTDAQKAFVNAAVLEKLTAAEEAFAAEEEQAKIDQQAADDVTKLINALDPGQRETVEAARAAYDALTEDQKALVSADTYNRLTEAELYIQTLDEQYEMDKKAADDAAALIDACDPSDRDSVAAAREAYDALDDIQKTLVDPAVYQKLLDAETAIIEEDNKIKTDQEAADSAIEAILACVPSDKSSVEAARAAYNALTEDQKALVSEETLQVLTDAEAAIEESEQSGKKNLLTEGLYLTDEYEWNGGNEVRPYDNWIMKRADYTFLYEGIDYEVSYSNNVDLGTASAIITGIGDFTGEIKTEFKVVPYDINVFLQDGDEYIELETKELTYNGSSRKVKLRLNIVLPGAFKEGIDYTISYPNGNKAVGRHTARVTCKGNYTGSGNFAFKIVPKGTSISKVSAVKKGFKIKWKKQATQTSGYQIRYSLKSNMKNSKVITVSGSKKISKEVKKLKAKKKYYVQVRTYKKVGGEKFYSAWSKKKSIKTK